MKKLFASTPILLFLILGLSGCNAVGEKSASLTIIYSATAVLSLLLLIGYFAAMVTVIIRAQIKKTIDTTAHAVILAIAVFVNIGVWFIEQLTSIEFEMLSISYIISELFLLGIHLVMNEYPRMKKIVKQVEAVQNYPEIENATADVMLEKPVEVEAISPECIELFIMGLKTLTPTEREIYDAHIARVTKKEIMANMNIKDTTLKYHNRNLYGKL